MRKELEEVVKDTAAVGLSATVLGLELGTELARKTFTARPRIDAASRPAPATPPSASAVPSATGVPAAPEPLEKDINVLAYQLWEQAGCPEGRDKEFYFQAEQELRHHNTDPFRTPATL